MRQILFFLVAFMVFDILRKNRQVVVVKDPGELQTLKQTNFELVVENERLKMQAVDDAIEAKNILMGALPVRVATFAAMVELLRLNAPRYFTVINDEIQGIESVPYTWDGVELFVYGTIVEPQPEL
jgi:hypothetical protein